MTAHDTSDSNRLRRIRNYHVGRQQSSLLVIQGFKRLACPSAPDYNFTLGKRSQIKGVQRVAPFQQRQVGRIDNVTARTHTQAGQSQAIKERTWSDGNAGDDMPQVARAAAWVLQFDGC